MCSFPLIRSKMNIVNISNRGSKGIYVKCVKGSVLQLCIFCE